MSITLNFELNDRDLEHFQAAMAAAKKAATGKSEQEIIDCAANLLWNRRRARCRISSCSASCGWTT